LQLKDLEKFKGNKKGRTTLAVIPALHLPMKNNPLRRVISYIQTGCQSSKMALIA